MKKIYIIAVILFTIPALAQEENPVEVPTIAIKIPLKQAVVLDDMTLTFLEVVEDSRCPTNTTCVWEGRAVIKVNLLLRDGTTKNKELELNNNKVSVIGTFGEKTLRALRLSPYPDANIPPAERAPYTLLVKKE